MKLTPGKQMVNKSIVYKYKGYGGLATLILMRLAWKHPPNISLDN